MIKSVVVVVVIVHRGDERFVLNINVEKWKTFALASK